MVRKSRLFMTITVLFVSAIAIANDGGYRSPFAVGVGARQLGMGGASVAFINSSGAVYWNPAGLAVLQRPQVQLFHMSLFMDTRYQFLSVAYPTMAGGFGLGIGDISSDDFDKIVDYATNGTFSSRQDLFLLGYGFSPTRKILAGITVKGVYFDIEDYKDTGFGLDLGIIYFLPFLKGTSFGLKLSDLSGPRIKLHRLEQRFPWSIRGGLSYSKAFSGKYGLLISADIEKTENNETDVYAGCELGVKDMVFARLGYMGDKITIGAGVSYYSFRFDYAYATLSDLGTSHRLSLSIDFGTPIEVKRELREKAIANEKVMEFKQKQEQEVIKKIQKELAIATKHEQNGKTYEAIEAYYRVLGLDDQNSQARVKVLELLNKMKEEMAKQVGKDYISNLVDKQIQLGNNYYHKKQYDKATEQFELALIIDPENREAIRMLADIEKINEDKITGKRRLVAEYIQNGDYERAIAVLNEILHVVPDDSWAIRNQAEVYRMFESSKYLDKAIRMFNDGEYESAAVQVDSALILNPRSEGAISLKRRLAQYMTKQTTLEDIKANDEHWRIYIQGMEKYQAGEYDKALDLWRLLLDYYPNNPNLIRNIEQARARSLKK
ncbi:MAG: hypothetical protein B6D58_03115 [candidate division Zixibacteria bacterium 4484_95]|nr:MAG: hypothetical protein B6D58_03115 [candidate division Zixibacteria bacterium 4484_95]